MPLPAELGCSQNYFWCGNKYCTLQTDTQAPEIRANFLTSHQV